tara:strand:- start:1208 stop:2377 length:1170 start_codon:yes stop_codon:yes gene_type:complete
MEKKKKYKILCVPANEGGCAYYRIITPYKKLEELYPDRVELRWNKNPLGMDDATGQWIPDWDMEDLKWCDIVMINNISNYGGPYTARIVGKAKEYGKIVHFDTDDLLTNLYEGHRLEKVYEDNDLYNICKFIYSNSDIVSVTQRKFAERIAEFVNGQLCVIKNAIDYNLPCWNQPKIPAERKKLCRFGWAGGIHHEEDVKEFAGVPNFVNRRVGIPHVSWELIGHPPPVEPGKEKDWQYEVWENYQKIILRGCRGQRNWGIHYALPPDQYGIFFSRLDACIAPLQMNEFNDSKSEIKVAECGRYSIPLIASNVGCYDETIINGETGWLMPPDAAPSDWTKVLTRIAKDKKWREEMGRNLHETTEKFFDLNKVVKFRIDMYDEYFKNQVS